MKKDNSKEIDFNPKAKDQHLDKLDKSALLSLLIIGLLALSIIYAYFERFSDFRYSSVKGDWGTFGDYIGGLLNPTISAAALYWLTRSFTLQKRELQETRLALENTSNSQAKQARSAEVAAKLQFLSIEMDAASSELATEFSYQMQILGVINSTGEQRNVFDKNGELRPAKEALQDINKKIYKLKSEINHIKGQRSLVAPEISMEMQAIK